MSLTENRNQGFLPGGATNSQNSPYISVWPLDHTTGFLIGPHPSCLLHPPTHNREILMKYSIYSHGTQAYIFNM